MIKWPSEEMKGKDNRKNKGEGIEEDRKGSEVPSVMLWCGWRRNQTTAHCHTPALPPNFVIKAFSSLIISFLITNNSLINLKQTSFCRSMGHFIAVGKTEEYIELQVNYTRQLLDAVE